MTSLKSTDFEHERVSYARDLPCGKDGLARPVKASPPGSGDWQRFASKYGNFSRAPKTIVAGFFRSEL